MTAVTGTTQDHDRLDQRLRAESVSWRLAWQWEYLELADGSLVLNGITRGPHVIARPPEWIRAALRDLDAGPVSVPELARRHLAGDVERLVRNFAVLAGRGILAADADHRRPHWASVELEERFATQLEWLAAFEDGTVSRWDLFRRLRRASVAVLGLGGAGSTVALMLAAAGVGRLRIVDGDVVESSNLVRQILYRPDQVGRQGKCAALADELTRFTPYTEVDAVPRYIGGPEDVPALIHGMDFVELCADAPRFVLNRWVDAACRSSRTPYLGAFAGSVGPMYVPGVSPCFECFERRMRRESGGRHDLIVEALAAKSSWRYPAFVTGPIGVAYPMVQETVHRLLGVTTPATVGGVLRVRYPSMTREPFLRDSECSCAGDRP